eukprot:m.98415 g.98415  ORF g.98415 m.98415 type:complete len:733 (+) comp14006_c0_seq4:361-2559(+)
MILQQPLRGACRFKWLALALLVVFAAAHASAATDDAEMDNAPETLAASTLTLGRLGGIVNWLLRAHNATRTLLRETRVKLAAETSRARAAEARLTPRWVANSINASCLGQISKEMRRSLAVELSLGQAMSAARAAFTETTGSLTSEVSRALASDASVQWDIEMEETRAVNIESSLSSSLSVEVSRATTTDVSLSTALTVETARASAVEQQLSSALQGEILRATTIDAALGQVFNSLSVCPANAVGAPNCKCDSGFTGTLTWTGNAWTGSCIAAPCPLNSNGAPSCQCNDGFVGALAWVGSAWAGVCSVAACPANSNGGPACTCNSGFTGALTWVGNAWTGTCAAAACPASSNGAPACVCNSGFLGTLTWSGSEWLGTCEQIPQLLHLSTGRTHTCGITAAGLVRCWGTNQYGEFGIGTTTSLISSSPVAAFPSVTNAVQVACGQGFTCVLLATGAMLCSGTNSHGQLGTGTQAPLSTPAQVTTGVTQISVGERHTCAVYTNGDMKCWGDNSISQLGLFNSYFSPSTAPLALYGVKQVSCGMYFTCALHTSGLVYCAGQYHAMGVGFNQIGNIGSDGSIACGGGHCCAIVASSNNAVKCWGNRYFGQLGDGTTGINDLVSFTAAPTPIASGVARITAGWLHSCAIETSGAVKCWGHNANGQLGVGSTDWKPLPTALAISGVKSIVAGPSSYHTCVVLLAGGFRCFGENAYGQLGVGLSVPSILSPTQIATVFI